jgi:4-amino-4-deoxy-L-arabinose transferase-like glycosyltransferase
MLNTLRNSRYWWFPIILIAAVWRVVVLASGAVSFHSDEAIVGLMARHINLGQPSPTFFYGQAYMGSLDPLLVAGAFRIFGESVLSIRVVQSLLYLLVVATTMILAYRISGSRFTAIIAGLFIALPPTLFTLYTTISLGGYAETLVIGNVLLIVAYDVRHGQINSWRHWALLGALVGLGWWTNNLIVVYVLPVGLYLLADWRQFRVRQVLIALAAFFVLSAPWWFYNLAHDWQSIRFLLGGFSATAGKSVGIGDRLAGLLLLGLPAITGVRFSWSMTAWAGLFAIPVIFIYIVLLIFARRRKNTRLLWLMLISVIAVFVISGFGVDATGRYLLPLYVPLTILTALQLTTPRRASSISIRQPDTPSLNLGRWTGAKVNRLAFITLVTLLTMNILGTLIATRTNPPGITPQFDAATDFTNDYDQQVIAFLRNHNGQFGYATYWATYRLAFLSGEAITLSPKLPYKASLIFTPSDRYPAYTAAVEAAEHPVFVTANLPNLDAEIDTRLTKAAITFDRQSIGPYTVFYNLSRRVNVQELGLQSIGANP